MATFHENLVQSFTNFKNKYITPIQTALNNKQDKLTNPLTQSDIVDNLTSTSQVKPLSAKQGKILNEALTTEIITTATDFNTLTTKLKYSINVAGCPNSPSPDSSGQLFVDNNNGYFKQFFVNDIGQVFVRYYDTRWHSWRADYIKKSGDAMSGSLNFANNTWNNIGDDCKFGDSGVAGGFALQGITGETRIHMNNTDGSKAGQLIFKNGGFFEFGQPVKFNGGITTPVQTSSSTILNWINNHGGNFGCMGFQNVSDAPTSTDEYAVFWFGSNSRIDVFAVVFTGTTNIYSRALFSGSWYGGWVKLPQMSVSGTTLNISL